MDSGCLESNNCYDFEYCKYSELIMDNYENNLEEFEALKKADKLKSIKSTIKRIDLVKNNDFFVEPLFIDEENEIIYFQESENSISIKKYLKNKKVSYSLLKTLMNRFIEIFVYLENNNLIIESINLDDFIIENMDVNNFKMILRRKFFNKNKECKNYYYGESIDSPEISNKRAEKISIQSNIYVLGKIFVNLVLNEFNIYDEEQESYYCYNINLFRDDLPYRFQNFIFKSYNLFIEERYKCMAELKYIFERIINDKYNLSDDSDTYVSFAGATNAGDMKIERSLKKLKDRESIDVNNLDKNHFNEDIYYCSTNINKDAYIFAVADGISNSSYGTGKEASNIILNNIIDIWDEMKDYIECEDDIVECLNEIVFTSNNYIVNRVNENIDIPVSNGISSKIMGSTLIIGIVFNNIMYYLSIGDSMIFVHNSTTGLNLINYEDNYGNEKLIKNLTWEEFKMDEENSMLTNIVGGGRFVQGKVVVSPSKFSIRKLQLNQDDLIIFCSDGVTDYIYSKGSYSDLWMVNTELNNVIEKNMQMYIDNDEEDIYEYTNRCINNLNDEIIEKVNSNGGGDNITIVSAKIIKERN